MKRSARPLGHDRNGDYEVHYIGVNWPHHIFVNQNHKVIGADDWPPR